MAWTNSKIFRPLLTDFFVRTGSFAVDLDGDSFKTALYDNDITPDNDVTAANSAYNVGQWVTTGNEVFEAGQWAQGGVTLTGVTLNSGTADVIFWDANDPTSGTAADLANVYGTLTYDDTVTAPVADQGVCYNYLGGANSVTGGQFTVVWHANGIWRITL
ncbi:hypothetical protein [Nonomuraea sp. NPDC050202]|jgi:hypothetical protein|uniref:hypothetical protein n=1 Tax=Nonomuraea sp. NPDC050202 TaxID=3155035 RepID=UPI0033CC90DB